jgi:aspartate-semialdehyde dehydrogenase
MPVTSPSIAIVGATGAVGREFLDILEQRRFPHGELRLLASARSAGSTLPYRGERHSVHELTDRSFEGIDIALFSAGGSISRQFGPVAVRAGAVVVDNSSAFRMDPAVPLVIPEVNPEAMEPFLSGARRPGIIANPNCSTVILLMAATPLHRALGIERMVVSTYQAVSGAGAAAMQELEDLTRDVLAGRPAHARIFSEPCAFNVFSHNSAVNAATGQNVEEEKMVLETRKIWNEPEAGGVRISATCIRVPTMRAHAESVNITLTRLATEANVRRILAAAPGVRVVDDREKNDFPTPLKAAGGDDTLVGRIRPDLSQDVCGEGDDRTYRGFNLFVCADQLRKGAALNAVQIAEMLVH